MDEDAASIPGIGDRVNSFDAALDRISSSVITPSMHAANVPSLSSKEGGGATMGTTRLSGAEEAKGMVLLLAFAKYPPRMGTDSIAAEKSCAARKDKEVQSQQSVSREY